MTFLERRAAYDRGRSAEDNVARDLESQGWTVLARNFRSDGGELDLVVERDGVVRIVEVKAREDGLDALEAVGPVKQRRLRAAAEAWLAVHGAPTREVAFLVAVVGPDGSVDYFDDPF